MIPISKPLLGDEEHAAVQRVLESGLLAQGPHVAQFEHAFADFVGVRHAIACSSGTTALHIALLAHGIGPGDEVITVPFTFMASVNAILYTGAKPVFVDIDESFTINPELIEDAITKHTKAIMPVHLYGQPADMGAICEIADRHGIIVIEDACQSHGAEFDGRKAGSFGTGCFSFYATKNMTTGEGGVVTTDNADVAQRARWIINHGMRERYYHDMLGYNYRMTEMAAALGVEQLKKLPSFNARRLENARLYSIYLEGMPGLLVPTVYPCRSHVYHQYTIRVTPASNCNRNELAESLSKQGIGVGIYYPVPAHRQAAIRALGLGAGIFPVAERMSEEVLSIPVHPGITDLERTFIIDSVIDHVNIYRDRHGRSLNKAGGWNTPVEISPPEAS